MNRHDAPQNEPQWLSVTDFAAARGCSIRTVKRWIENGEVNTRKDGARRFVRALEEGTQSDTEGTQQKGHELGAVSLSIPVHAQKEGHKGHAEGTQSDTDEARAVSLREAQLRDELARERELNGFLRGLMEGHQRSEAELRAALREALKIAPRQLAAGDSSTSGADATNGLQKGEANNVPREHTDGAETPVSYGSIADELERMMNR